MRTMYDSVNARAIPTDAQMVAGYVDGIYRWSQQDWDRFPGAVKVRISAVGATSDAEVFDVEVGCIWPPEKVVPLVVAARKRGIDPTVYVNRQNDWAPTQRAFDRAGVPHPHWWVAEYDGEAEVPPGSVAKQYAHPGEAWEQRRPPTVPWETGKHYDLSAVADYWPGVDAQGEDDVQLTDRMENAWGTNPTIEEVYRMVDYRVWENGQKIDAVITLVGELAKDPALTPERAREIVQNAVAEANAAHLNEVNKVITEIVGARDEDLANEVVDEISRRTRGAA